jgi:hypothetical protein
MAVSTRLNGVRQQWGSVDHVAFGPNMEDKRAWLGNEYGGPRKGDKGECYSVNMNLSS